MTGNEWLEWKATYIRRFLGPDERRDFVDEWKNEILKRELADMLEAIGAVAIDPRPEARFPRQQLRLLLEFADAKADGRREWKDPLAGQPPPERTSAWNLWMLNRGVITRAEFNKRERAKERA